MALICCMVLNNSPTRILTSKVWYHISLYNEQCKLAIHFAKHNFGPFGHIFFVIVSFEPESKTLFRVLFSNLCLQIFIFYICIYRIFIFLARPMQRTSKQSTVYILGVWKNRKSILQVKVLPVAWFDVHRMAKHTRGARVRVKPDILKNSK